MWISARRTIHTNLKELEVVESKRNTIRKGLVHELLNAQDTVLCSYFAQRSGEKDGGRNRKSKVEEVFQGLDSFE
jgi:hypothetical protein